MLIGCDILEATLVDRDPLKSLHVCIDQVFTNFIHHLSFIEILLTFLAGGVPPREIAKLALV